jgi:hypothetical protein
MKDTNHKRLLKLARHLGSKHLNNLLANKAIVYQSSLGNNSIECFSWAFGEFPNIFPEWRFDEQSNPCLKKKPELNGFTATIYFLELDVDEMFHLFVSGYQMPHEYLGQHLRSDATPGQLSSNIYEYLRAIGDKAMESNILVDPTDILLTSLKTTNNERNENYLSAMCA